MLFLMWEKNEDVNSGNLFMWREAVVLTWEATAVILERFPAWDQMPYFKKVSNLNDENEFLTYAKNSIFSPKSKVIF